MNKPLFASAFEKIDICSEMVNSTKIEDFIIWDYESYESTMDYWKSRNALVICTEYYRFYRRVLCKANNPDSCTGFKIFNDFPHRYFNCNFTNLVAIDNDGKELHVNDVIMRDDHPVTSARNIKFQLVTKIEGLKVFTKDKQGNSYIDYCEDLMAVNTTWDRV